jgi:ABC-2 type transport system ATP-binding protein
MEGQMPDSEDYQEILLETCELTRSYGSFLALDALDLEVREGECVAVMGPNGSGKTTAAELVSGLLEPTSGWARVCGVSIHQEPHAAEARRHLAYVPDTARLYDDLTVSDHLRLVAAAHGVGGTDIQERCLALLRRLDLDYRADYPPSQLSRGMRQKTALACALIRPFSVLVLDEPVVGLDTPSLDVLREVLLETVAAHRAVLLMTHSDAFAASVATRTLRLEEGRLVG